MKLLTTIFALLAFSLAFTNAAQAGSFGVSPIKVELTGAERATTLTVRNDGPEPVAIQVDAMRWYQEQGDDALEPTRDIIASPTIFELAPGATQIVRVGRLRPPAEDRELPYRLVLREIPKTSRQGVSVALRISLPVFVKPETAIEPALRWSWHRTDEGLVLRVRNDGSQHSRVAGFTIDLPGDAAPLRRDAFYVLPGSHMDLELEGFELPIAAKTHALVDGKRVDLEIPAL